MKRNTFLVIFMNDSSFFQGVPTNFHAFPGNDIAEIGYFQGVYSEWGECHQNDRNPAGGVLSIVRIPPQDGTQQFLFPAETWFTCIVPLLLTCH